MDWLALVRDNLAAVAEDARDRTVAFAKGQVVFALMSTAVGAIIFWYLAGRKDGLWPPLIAIAGGVGGTLVLNYLWHLARAPFRLKNAIPRYGGQAMAQDMSGFVAGWKTVGLRGRLLLTLEATGEVPAVGEVACEFAYPRPPWAPHAPGSSLMLWWGVALARFPEGGNLIEVEYPKDFDSASPAFDFEPPEIQPLDQHYSVVWKDTKSGGYLARYDLIVEDRS